MSDDDPIKIFRCNECKEAKEACNVCTHKSILLCILSGVLDKPEEEIINEISTRNTLNKKNAIRKKV